MSTQLPTRQFTFTYHVKIPALASHARLWVPLPCTNHDQNAGEVSLECSSSLHVEWHIVEGNRVLYVELPESSEPRTLTVSFNVERKQYRTNGAPVQDATTLDIDAFQRYIAPDRRVPTDGRFAEEAQALVGGETDDYAKARAVFDHMLATYSYDASGCTPDKGDALGDLAVACDLKLGTCTELHGLFVAYLRALSVPARFVFGFNVPKRSEGQIGGYHCWSEVFLSGRGWVPIDVSEARKRPAGLEREFYFGGLDENRVQFSSGRDLTLVPAQSTGPIDKFIFPHCEADSEPVSVMPEFRFRDLAPAS